MTVFGICANTWHPPFRSVLFTVGVAALPPHSLENSASIQNRRWCIDNHRKRYERGSFSFLSLFFFKEIGCLLFLFPLFYRSYNAAVTLTCFIFHFFYQRFVTGRLERDLWSDDLMIVGLVDSSTSESLVIY